MSSQESHSSPPLGPAKIDPILRNALRYTISAKEYKTLHQYLIIRTPPAVRKQAPQPPRYSSIVQTKDDFNAAAIRASLRVFIASQTGLKLWDLIATYVLRRDRPQKCYIQALKGNCTANLPPQTKIKCLRSQISQFPSFPFSFPHPPPPSPALPFLLPPPYQPSHQGGNPFPSPKPPHLTVSNLSSRSCHWRKSSRVRAGGLPRGSIADHDCNLCCSKISRISL